MPFYFGFSVYVVQSMYAAVTDLKSLVRDLLPIILMSFMRFQRQAYGDVRSGLNILNIILFEIVAVYTDAMTLYPAKNHLQKEVVLEMRKKWFC